MKSHFGRKHWLHVGLLAAVLSSLAVAPGLEAHHGDIHARCNGSQAVVTQRPPGMEHVQVVCVKGLPEFVVTPAAVPTYNPITQAPPESRALPPDFGGWVTVWLNGRPLKTPYAPTRGIQEPGPYLSSSSKRVMMPVRFFTEAFDGTVEWNEANRRGRFVLGSKQLQLNIGKREAIVGARSVKKLDAAPVIFQDRMFVPVRFLAETMGARVEWDHINRGVHVYLDDAACNNPTYCGEVR